MDAGQGAGPPGPVHRHDRVAAAAQARAGQPGSQPHINSEKRRLPSDRSRHAGLLMRLAPAVPIGLIIVSSVTIVWVGTVALFYLSTSGADRNTRPLPGQVAALVSLLEHASPAEQQLILRAVTSRSMTARLEPGNHVGITPQAERVPRITERAVDQYLAAIGGRPSSVVVQGRSRGTGGLGFTFAAPVDLELRGPPWTGHSLLV